MIKHDPQKDISLLAPSAFQDFSEEEFRAAIDNLMTFDVIQGLPPAEIKALRRNRIRRLAPKLVRLCLTGQTKEEAPKALRYLGAKCALAGKGEVCALMNAIGVMNLSDRLLAYGLLVDCGGKETRDAAVSRLLSSSSKMQEPTKQKVAILATAAAFADTKGEDFQKACTAFFALFDEVYRTPAARQSFADAFLKKTHGAESEAFAAKLQEHLLADKKPAELAPVRTTGTPARIVKRNDPFGLLRHAGTFVLHC